VFGVTTDITHIVRATLQVRRGGQG
jgi:hypothetical protein